MNNDPNVINGFEDLMKFLQEHPDAQITSVKRVSTNLSTGKRTEQTIYGSDEPPRQTGRKPDPGAERRKKELEEAKEKQKKYEKDLKDWENSIRPIEQKRAQELEKALEAEQEKQRMQILERYADAIRSEAMSFAEAELDENRLREDMNMLGSFRHSERNAIQEAQARAREQKKNAESRAKEAKERKEKELKDLPDYLRHIRQRLESEIADRFPAPKKPALSQYLSYQEQKMLKDGQGTSRAPTAKQVENEGFKEDILAFMDPGVQYTCEDILKQVPSIVASGMSLNRVSALLIQLTQEGMLNKSVDVDRTNYFSLN